MGSNKIKFHSKQIVKRFQKFLKKAVSIIVVFNLAFSIGFYPVQSDAGVTPESVEDYLARINIDGPIEDYLVPLGDLGHLELFERRLGPLFDYWVNPLATDRHLNFLDILNAPPDPELEQFIIDFYNRTSPYDEQIANLGAVSDLTGSSANTNTVVVGNNTLIFSGGMLVLNGAVFVLDPTVEGLMSFAASANSFAATIQAWMQPVRAVINLGSLQMSAPMLGAAAWGLFLTIVQIVTTIGDKPPRTRWTVGFNSNGQLVSKDPRVRGFSVDPNFAKIHTQGAIRIMNRIVRDYNYVLDKALYDFYWDQQAMTAAGVGQYYDPFQFVITGTPSEYPKAMTNAFEVVTNFLRLGILRPAKNDTTNGAARFADNVHNIYAQEATFITRNTFNYSQRRVLERFRTVVNNTCRNNNGDAYSNMDFRSCLGQGVSRGLLYVNPGQHDQTWDLGCADAVPLINKSQLCIADVSRHEGDWSCTSERDQGWTCFSDKIPSSSNLNTCTGGDNCLGGSNQGSISPTGEEIRICRITQGNGVTYLTPQFSSNINQCHQQCMSYSDESNPNRLCRWGDQNVRVGDISTIQPTDILSSYSDINSTEQRECKITQGNGTTFLTPLFTSTISTCHQQCMSYSDESNPNRLCVWGNENVRVGDLLNLQVTSSSGTQIETVTTTNLSSQTDGTNSCKITQGNGTTYLTPEFTSTISQCQQKCMSYSDESNPNRICRWGSQDVRTNQLIESQLVVDQQSTSLTGGGDPNDNHSYVVDQNNCPSDKLSRATNQLNYYTNKCDSDSSLNYACTPSKWMAGAGVPLSCYVMSGSSTVLTAAMTTSTNLESNTTSNVSCNRTRYDNLPNIAVNKCLGINGESQSNWWCNSGLSYTYENEPEIQACGPLSELQSRFTQLKASINN